MEARKQRPKLKPHVEKVLQLWLNGYDMQTGYPIRKFWRIRKDILKKVGVDINLFRRTQDEKIKGLKFDLDYLKLYGKELEEIQKG